MILPLFYRVLTISHLAGPAAHETPPGHPLVGYSPKIGLPHGGKKMLRNTTRSVKTHGTSRKHMLKSHVCRIVLISVDKNTLGYINLSIIAENFRSSYERMYWWCYHGYVGHIETRSPSTYVAKAPTPSTAWS